MQEKKQQISNGITNIFRIVLSLMETEISLLLILQIPQILHVNYWIPHLQFYDGCSNLCFSNIVYLYCKCFQGHLSLQEFLYNPRCLWPLQGPHQVTSDSLLISFFCRCLRVLTKQLFQNLYGRCTRQELGRCI